MKLLDYFKTGHLSNGNGSTAPAVSKRAQSFSIGDPALADFLLANGYSAAGETVTPETAVNLTAVYRSVALIAGTIATVPLKSYRTLKDGSRIRQSGWLDNPAGPDSLTPFEWKEYLLVCLLMHGNGYGLKRFNQGGGLIGLQLLPPQALSVKQDPSVPGGKLFTVSLANGTKREYTAADIVHFTAMSTDGLIGLSPITVARQAIGTGLAGDKATARTFQNGFLLGGMVSSKDLDEKQGREILQTLKAGLAGAEHAGDIAVVNAELSFSPWTMSAEDAQFIQSRSFQVEEIARMYGIPKVLLAQDGASTWGSGIAELIRGMQKFTFAPWTSRIEERLSLLLPQPRFCEFDYAGLLQPTETEATQNMIAEINAGILTVDEARRIKNRPPLNAQPSPPQPEDENDPGTE